MSCWRSWCSVAVPLYMVQEHLNGYQFARCRYFRLLCLEDLCDGFVGRVYSGCVDDLNSTDSDLPLSLLLKLIVIQSASCRGSVQTLKLAECLNV